LYWDILNVDKDKIDLNILILHEEALANSKLEILNNKNLIKILASSKNATIGKYDGVIKLPTKVDDINFIVEQTEAKKIFNKNSSIKIKEYLLDKNEKKLNRNNLFVILTEKEIQLLELFLHNKEPISKNSILSLIWKYSSEADTHTVETHIYRLRKKITDKFSDEKFILNNKSGYYL